MANIEMDEGTMELPREPWTVLRAVTRHRFLLCVLAIAGLASGALVGRTFIKDKFRSEAVLLYSPLVKDDVGGAPIPELGSRQHMIKVQPVLENAIKRLSLPMPAARLSDACDVRVERDSNVMSIGVEWPDADGAARIANALADAFLEQQGSVRRSGMQRTIDELERQQGLATTAMRNAADAMRTFRQRHNVVNVDDEIRAAITELLSLQSQLHLARIEQQNLALKRQSLGGVVQSVRKQLPAAVLTSAEDRSEQSARLQYLRSSLDADVTTRERQVNLERAAVEVSRNQRLVAKGLVASVEADRAVAEYQRAKLYVQDTPATKAWREQIQSLERSVYGPPGSTPPPATLGTEVAIRTFQIELDNVGLSDKVTYLSGAVSRMQAKLAAYPAIQRELFDLQEQTGRYERELTALEAPLAQARRVRASEAPDFVMLSRAVPAGFPTGQRRRVAAVALGFLFVLVGLAGVITGELCVGTIRSSRELAHFTALPVWARLPSIAEWVPHALTGPLGDLGARMFRLSRSVSARSGTATRILVAGPASPETKQRVVDALVDQYVRAETRVATISLAGGQSDRLLACRLHQEESGADLAPEVAPDLRGAQRTRELLRAASERSDVVILSCDSMVDAPELLSLSVQCDVLLLLAQAGATTRDEVVGLARQLRSAGVENGAWVLEGVSADFLDIEPDEA